MAVGVGVLWDIQYVCERVKMWSLDAGRIEGIKGMQDLEVVNGACEHYRRYILPKTKPIDRCGRRYVYQL